MSSLRHLRTQTGRSIALGKQLGKGGEGIVFEVQGDASLAAKIYHRDKAAERQQKIESIVAAQWHKTTSCVAFPVDALVSPAGQFLGFTMARIARNKPIHDLYSPTRFAGRCARSPGALAAAGTPSAPGWSADRACRPVHRH
jgi:DNA-binding helix-hairpin-helix protein with protein kinase domain